MYRKFKICCIYSVCSPAIIPKRHSMQATCHETVMPQPTCQTIRIYRLQFLLRESEIKFNLERKKYCDVENLCV